MTASWINLLLTGMQATLPASVRILVDEKVGFKELEKYALEHDNVVNVSGRQEMLESVLNQYILES